MYILMLGLGAMGYLINHYLITSSGAASYVNGSKLITELLWLERRNASLKTKPLVVNNGLVDSEGLLVRSF